MVIEQLDEDQPDWFFDYGLMDDISAADFTAPPLHLSPPPPPPAVSFGWLPTSCTSVPAAAAAVCSSYSTEIESSFIDFEGLTATTPRSQKRLKCETINECGSKAGREKRRRDRMNERFMELGLLLEPGRPPKTDKTAILSDVIRMIKQLRDDAQKLNESNADLHEKIKELKAEKNELRDEKNRLKVEKDKLEQQVKSINGGCYLAHPTTMRAAAFAARDHSAGNKLMPFVSYPSVAMWQFMPSSVVDTSQDHVLRPPVA